MKKINFTWQEFDVAVESLYQQIIIDMADYDSIYGIERGGLILAVCLSHKLRIPLVREIRENTLVVDDINDTGKTLMILSNYINGAISAVATIHLKAQTEFNSDYIYRLVEDDSWIVYPWELQDSITKKDNE